MAAGWTRNTIARPAIALAGLMTAFSYLLQLWLVPESFRAFRELQFTIRHKYASILLQEGVFNQVTNGLMVYVRERASNGELVGIVVHDSRNRGHPVTMMAERGSLVLAADGPRVVMVNGNRQEAEPDTGRLKVLYFERNTIDLNVVGEDTGPRYREPRERPLGELLSVTRKEVGDQDFGRFRAEAHQRLATPFLNLGFVLVGLAILLAGGFGRSPQAPRVIVAVLAVIALQAGMLGVINLAAKQLDLVPLIYVHALAPVIVGYYALRQAPEGRSPVLAGPRRAVS